jgi:hypothetical protein
MREASHRAVLLSLAFALAASVAVAADPTGTWIGSTEVPDVGTIQVTLVLKKAEGGFAGIVSDSASLIAPETPVKDLKIEGDAITFWFNLADGTSVSMQLKVSGETMTGGWQHESGQTGSMQLERKK